MMSNTFAGIRPADAPEFIVAELVGAGVGWGLHALLTSRSSEEHKD